MRNSITEGSIWRPLLSLFFPILLGTFFQQFYNTVDAIIVGNFVGKEALAAVGGTTAVLINFLVNLFVGLSSGATVVIAQYYGGRQLEQLRRTVHTGIALALAAGVAVMALGLLLARPVLTLMGTPADIMGYALSYLRIYFLGTVASFIYNMGASILRAVGDTKRPLYYLMAACMVNIVLDVVFVVFLDLKVAGAAIATILSQLVSAALVLLALVQPQEVYFLSFREIRFHKDVLMQVLRIGLPSGLQADMYTISNMLLQSCINTFGTNTIAAWTAFGKVDGFYWMASSAFGVAITTFVGQNFGARKYQRVRRGVRVGLGLSALGCVIITVVTVVLRYPLTHLFATDPKVVQICVQMLLMLTPTYITYMCIEVFSGVIRGVGEALIPMIITGLSICVFRVVWILWILPLHNTLGMICISYPISWVMGTIAFFIYYKKGKWLTKRLPSQTQEHTTSSASL